MGQGQYREYTKTGIARKLATAFLIFFYSLVVFSYASWKNTKVKVTDYAVKLEGTRLKLENEFDRIGLCHEAYTNSVSMFVYKDTPWNLLMKESLFGSISHE